MTKRTVRAKSSRIPTILVGVLHGRSVEFSIQEIQELLRLPSREATVERVEEECQRSTLVYKDKELIGVRVPLSSLTAVKG